MLNRLLSLAALTLCALIAYLLIAAQWLAQDVHGPADQALVAGLRVLAGAAAIPACAIGLFFIGLRDEANARAREAGSARTDAGGGAVDRSYMDDDGR